MSASAELRSAGQPGRLSLHECCCLSSTYNAASFSIVFMHILAAQDQRSRRGTIAALVFVACSLLSSGRIFWDARTSSHLKGASINVGQRSDERFAAVRTLLPQRGVIGYIGESGALARGDYYLAEYALAPLVVDDSPNHPAVLANFPDSPSPIPSNLRLMKDFGNGVALYANALYVNKDAK
jgi:hypothetical protein